MKGNQNTVLETAPAEERELLSVPEACEMLAIGRTTLYKLIHGGDIPAFRLARGGRWKFKREALTDWLELQQARHRR